MSRPRQVARKHIFLAFFREVDDNIRVNTEQIRELDKKFIMNTYGERKTAFVRGKGARMWDADGREYLDLFSGIAVTALGHCHPRVVRAIGKQSSNLGHISNLYCSEPQVILAQMLVENSFADKVFFCNSGAEANEAAIKLARKYGSGTGRFEIITMERSFHGRTLATLSATGQEKFHKGYKPLVDGFTHIPFNDIDALTKKVSEKTVAVMLEPIQGEGGFRLADDRYIKEVQALCRKLNILLIFDEIQCGLGRTGKLLAYEHYGVTPDIMTLAKPLGGGLPLGAMLAREEIAANFIPGDHASTFGGNPVCCRAGIETLKIILGNGFLERVSQLGAYLLKLLEGLAEGQGELIVEARGRGLMAGIELKRPCKDIADKCLEQGLLVNCTDTHFLRFLPPLTVTEDELSKGVEILGKVLSNSND